MPYMTQPTWFVCCLLFALHPIHTEVVANIKSRDELLALLFLLLQINLILSKNSGLIKNQVILATLVFFSLLAKESSLTFLGVLFILLVQIKQVKFTVAIKHLALSIAVALLWLGLRYWVIYHNSPPILPLTIQDNALLNCTNTWSAAIGIFGFYLIKFIWPTNFSYDYSLGALPCYSATSLQTIFTVLCVLVLLVTAIYYFRKQALASFGILFFFLTIAITANVFFKIGTTFAERILFIPSLGLCIAVTLGGRRIFEHLKPWNSILVASITLFFLTITWTRVNAWKSNETLYTTDGKNSNGSARIKYNYATMMLNENNSNLHSTKILLMDAVKIDPNYKDAWINLGITCYRLKEYDNAAHNFTLALKFNPNDWLVNHYLADAYTLAKQYDKAITLYNLCLNNNYTQLNTHNFLGLCYFNTNQPILACEHFKKGIEQNPNLAEVWINYGNALGATEQYEKALHAFNRALELDASASNVLYFLALTYNKMGNTKEAQYYLNLYTQNNRVK